MIALDAGEFAVPVAFACVFLGFTLSASAGMGGSLIVVPVMALLLGPKAGIAVAALLLAFNNVGKVVAYRKTVPLRAALVVIALTVAGAMLGARFMTGAPETLVHIGIVASIALAFWSERHRLRLSSRVSTPALALLAGCMSGFSGTSGPLKGLALRHLGLDRFHFVGAASAVSMAGDLGKTAVYTQAGILTGATWWLVLCCAPVVPLAVFVGRRINRTLGESAFATLFWTVMLGYGARLVLA